MPIVVLPFRSRSCLKRAVAFLTDFADQAVILPVALSVAALLGLLGWWRGAVAWAVSVGGTLVAILALKLVFGACGPAWRLDIESPSGHTAAATAAYGGLLILLGMPPPIALASAAGIAGLIGLSRVELRMHTPPEVALGALVGLAGVVLFVRLMARFARPVPRTALIAILLVVVLVFHGAHVHAETVIRRLTLLLDVWPFSACRGMMPS